MPFSPTNCGIWRRFCVIPVADSFVPVHVTGVKRTRIVNKVRGIDVAVQS